MDVDGNPLIVGKYYKKANNAPGIFKYMGDKMRNNNRIYIFQISSNRLRARFLNFRTIPPLRLIENPEFAEVDTDGEMEINNDDDYFGGSRNMKKLSRKSRKKRRRTRRTRRTRKYT
jgi:hypothetical protein